jgi:hypothetical protein
MALDGLEKAAGLVGASRGGEAQGNQGSKASAFFFEKKNRKTFAYQVSLLLWEKFFASFFQKRSAFLLSI